MNRSQQIIYTIQEYYNVPYEHERFHHSPMMDVSVHHPYVSMQHFPHSLPHMSHSDNDRDGYAYGHEEPSKKSKYGKTTRAFLAGAGITGAGAVGAGHYLATQVKHAAQSANTWAGVND